MDVYAEFWNLNRYVAGSYDNSKDFEKLNDELCKQEVKGRGNRIFYLALPPSVFEPVTKNISTSLAAKKYLPASSFHAIKFSKYCTGLLTRFLVFSGWTRVIIEKPFGKDADSSALLSKHLESLFAEEQIYRIDHYLGKEMVQNLMVLRYCTRSPEYKPVFFINIFF